VQRRSRRILAALGALLLAPVLALVVASFLVPLPPELAEGRPPSTGTVLRDRHGVVIRELLADDGTRARWASLDEIGEPVQRAIQAAEDARFLRHPGVDPLAIARALGQLVVHRRVVSGASTLTQQLARAVVKRPRTWGGKFLEAALALRIERALGKRAILEQYLNRVSFGPGVRGVEAASRFYFDKPSRDLSLAEAAALSGIPRGPSLYDPRKGTARLKRRRDRVLGRMLAAGFAGREEVDRALAEPIAVIAEGGSPGAPHLVRAVMRGSLGGDAPPMRERTRELTLTLDRRLQREVEALAQATVRSLARRKVSAAAVVVIDNESGDLLAYVGSPDIEDTARLGHNDGVLALRQPGSTLKPFVYELAMERLGFTAATVLPDVELFLAGKDGDYRPNNYDGRLHGPVLLREALANSYNVPAVWTVEALGPARALARFTALGLTSLDREAEHYGAALALGDGEVRLLDLANAYATLARGGVRRPVRAVKTAVGKDGTPLALPRADDVRVLDEAETAVITDVLADKDARLSSFGEGNALEMPFPVAAKTGTSKGFRDNYALGYTREVTVGVWVGNFDGSPMEGVSGISGAAPLFHDAMLAAMRAAGAAEPAPLAHAAGLVEAAEVCPISGRRPGPDCPHRRREIFALREGRSTAPEATCITHVRVRVDKRNGLRAGEGCPPDQVEERVFERFEATYTAWARSVGRAMAPESWSPLCPGTGPAIPSGGGRLRIAYPPDGARFSVDPGASATQAIRVRADVPPGVDEVRITVDGHARPLKAPFAISLPLTPGEHRVRVEAEGAGADEVGFSVD
jgi:penicillin-binding protein 1C